MKQTYTRKRERFTGRIKGPRPQRSGNRSMQREEQRAAMVAAEYRTESRRAKHAYQITRALKSLIAAGRYCPPGRHFGNYTKPVVKKGDR